MVNFSIEPLGTRRFVEYLIFVLIIIIIIYRPIFITMNPDYFLGFYFEEYYTESLFVTVIKILSLQKQQYKITELPYTLTRSKLKHRNKISLHFTTSNGDGTTKTISEMTHFINLEFHSWRFTIHDPKFITKQIRI